MPRPATGSGVESSNSHEALKDDLHRSDNYLSLEAAADSSCCDSHPIVFIIVVIIQPSNRCNRQCTHSHRMSSCMYDLSSHVSMYV